MSEAVTGSRSCSPYLPQGLDDFVDARDPRVAGTVACSGTNMKAPPFGKILACPGPITDSSRPASRPSEHLHVTGRSLAVNTPVPLLKHANQSCYGGKHAAVGRGRPGRAPGVFRGVHGSLPEPHVASGSRMSSRKFRSTLRGVYNAESVVIVPGGGTYGMEAVARQLATDRKCMVLPQRVVQLSLESDIRGRKNSFRGDRPQGASCRGRLPGRLHAGADRRGRRSDKEPSAGPGVCAACRGLPRE